MSKSRPIILWLDKSNWHKSMTFGIPLSTSDLNLIDKYNHLIKLEHYTFLGKNKIDYQPRRAVINQATRINGNILKRSYLIGKLTDTVVQKEIENKLFDWLFSS